MKISMEGGCLKYRNILSDASLTGWGVDHLRRKKKRINYLEPIFLV